MSGFPENRPISEEDVSASGLVPVVDPESLALLQADAGAPLDEPGFILDGLLEDALFGEVIDISELIAGMISPSDLPRTGEAIVPMVSAELPDVALDPLAEQMATPLSIFYDDDLLASDGGIL